MDAAAVTAGGDQDAVVAGGLHWCAARVSTWASRSGRPAPPTLRHAARTLWDAPRAAGLVGDDDGDAGGGPRAGEPPGSRQ